MFAELTIQVFHKVNHCEKFVLKTSETVPVDGTQSCWHNSRIIARGRVAIATTEHFRKQLKILSVRNFYKCYHIAMGRVFGINPKKEK